MDRQILEERIAQLEQTVFGSSVPATVKDGSSCLETLQQVNSKFEESTAKRDKVQRILARLTEIEKYMDSRFAEETAMSTDCKMQVILSEEQRIRQTAAALERLSELKSVLDSEHLKVDKAMLEKFAEIKQKQLEQSETTQKLEADTYLLLNAYFSSMDLVSKQFAAWHKRVRHAEGK